MNKQIKEQVKLDKTVLPSCPMCGYEDGFVKVVDKLEGIEQEMFQCPRCKEGFYTEKQGDELAKKFDKKIIKEQIISQSCLLCGTQFKDEKYCPECGEADQILQWSKTDDLNKQIREQIFEEFKKALGRLSLQLTYREELIRDLAIQKTLKCQVENCNDHADIKTVMCPKHLEETIEHKDKKILRKVECVVCMKEIIGGSIGSNLPELGIKSLDFCSIECMCVPEDKLKQRDQKMIDLIEKIISANKDTRIIKGNITETESIWNDALNHIEMELKKSIKDKESEKCVHGISIKDNCKECKVLVEIPSCPECGHENLRVVKRNMTFEI